MVVLAPSPDPLVSVVIVNWNSGDSLRACIDSLLGSTQGPRLEIVVVDNASTDASAALATDHHPDILVIANATNRGLAAANNQGIDASTTPYVLISNPDVIYLAGAVDALVDVMHRRPKAAFVVARHEYPDGTVQTAAGDLPRLRDAVLGRQIARSRRRVNAGFWWDGWPHDEECQIGHGLEACYLVRRTAIDAVGTQDERFALDWEGIDWSERMAAGGWEIWFCPTARVVHLGGISIRRAQARWVLRQHRGMYHYFATRRHRVLRPALAVLFVARATIKLVGLAVRLTTYERSSGSPRP